MTVRSQPRDRRCVSHVWVHVNSSVPRARIMHACEHESSWLLPMSGSLQHHPAVLHASEHLSLSMSSSATTTGVAMAVVSRSVTHWISSPVVPSKTWTPSLGMGAAGGGVGGGAAGGDEGDGGGARGGGLGGELGGGVEGKGGAAGGIGGGGEGGQIISTAKSPVANLVRVRVRVKRVRVRVGGLG